MCNRAHTSSQFSSGTSPRSSLCWRRQAPLWPMSSNGSFSSDWVGVSLRAKGPLRPEKCSVGLPFLSFCSGCHRFKCYTHTAAGAQGTRPYVLEWSALVWLWEYRSCSILLHCPSQSHKFSPETPAKEDRTCHRKPEVIGTAAWPTEAWLAVAAALSTRPYFLSLG